LSGFSGAARDPRGSHAVMKYSKNVQTAKEEQFTASTWDRRPTGRVYEA